MTETKFTLNDLARFWFSVASTPDFIDDPDGFRHPLADRAAALGVSPGRLYDFCRHVQEFRSKLHPEGNQAGGDSGSLGFQSLNTCNQFVAHQKNPSGLVNHPDIATLNAKAAGVHK